MKYKRACRNAEKQARQRLKDKLMNIGMNNPKSFWSIINKMNNWGKIQTEDTEHIKPSTWAKYFKNLLNKYEPDKPLNSTDNTVESIKQWVRHWTPPLTVL